MIIALIWNLFLGLLVLFVTSVVLIGLAIIYLIKVQVAGDINFYAKQGIKFAKDSWNITGCVRAY